LISIQNYLSETITELRSRPLIAIGFSFFWTWVWAIVQSSFLNQQLFFSMIPYVNRWVIPLAAYGGTFLLFGVLFKRTGLMLHKKPYLIVVCVATVYGVVSSALYSFYPLPQEMLNITLLVISGLIMGSGTACIHMEFGRLLGQLGPRKTIIHVAFGTIGALAINMLIFFLLPQSISWIAIAFLPIGCIVAILAQTPKMPKQEAVKNTAPLNLPWRFLITSFIQGTSFGILQYILPSHSEATLTTFVSVSGSLIGACALFYVALKIRLDFNQLIYQVGFVLLGLGFVLMALAGHFFIGGWMLNAIGYRWIDILMWALCTYLVKQRGLPTNWVFAVTTCALLMGQVFGVLLGTFSQDVFGSASMGMNTLTVLMVFIVLASALFLFNKSNLSVGWGMIRPGDVDDQIDDLYNRCMLATDGFDLTAREFEIFVLLAKGHNRFDIGSQLVLSKETIKTHVRNIYRKMGIHSHRELIHSVERQGSKETNPQEATSVQV